MGLTHSQISISPHLLISVMVVEKVSKQSVVF